MNKRKLLFLIVFSKYGKAEKEKGRILLAQKFPIWTLKLVLRSGKI